jgi:hypothetical protein
VVISGDLLEGGYPAGYRRVRQELEKLDAVRPERMSILPGNHDLFFYPAVLCGKPRRFFWQHLGITLRQAGQSSWLRLATRNKRGQAFWDAFGDLVPAEFRVRDGKPLPFVKPIGENIVVVGVDTTPRRTSKLPGRHHLMSVAGHARPGDWSAIEHALDTRWADHRRVVLMHHYPFRGAKTGFRKRDYLRLWQFLRRIRAEAVLCGHIHVSNGPTVRRGMVSILCQGTSGGVHYKSPTYSLHDFTTPHRPQTRVLSIGYLPRWWHRKIPRMRRPRVRLPA